MSTIKYSICMIAYILAHYVADIIVRLVIVMSVNKFNFSITTVLAMIILSILVAYTVIRIAYAGCRKGDYLEIGDTYVHINTLKFIGKIELLTISLIYISNELLFRLNETTMALLIG